MDGPCLHDSLRILNMSIFMHSRDRDLYLTCELDLSMEHKMGNLNSLPAFYEYWSSRSKVIVFTNRCNWKQYVPCTQMQARSHADYVDWEAAKILGGDNSNYW